MRKIIIVIILVHFGSFVFGNTWDQNYGRFYKTFEFTYAKGLSLSTDSEFDMRGWGPGYTKSLRIGAGWFVNPHLSVGLGFGADRYEDPGANTFPLFLDFRGFLRNNSSTPFAFVNVGKTVAFSAAQEKGNLFETGLGYQLGLSRKTRLSCKIGYGFFKSNEFYRNELDWNYLKRKSLRFVVGLVF